MTGRQSPRGLSQIILPGGHVVRFDAADEQIVLALSWQFLSGYAVTRIDGRLIAMHRVLLGARPGEFVDHANRDRLDNRRANLRFCSISQNVSNRVCRPTEAGYRGVRTEKLATMVRYRAEIKTMNRKTRGPFRSTPLDAAIDYDRLAAAQFGAFAVLNFPVQS